MIKKLYPQGKSKAFNITFDDGVLQDMRFVRLLDKYGIKGTFNLNSQLMAEEFCWTHPSGMVVKRLPQNVVTQLYQNHEVASHTLTHPNMENLPRDEVMRQLWQDKINLEQLFGREICGFALPFDFYSPLIAECAQNCGFEYARMSQRSFCYTPSENYYFWQCGVFHLDEIFNSYVENFFATEEELALCQIVGHSYDLDSENMWEAVEKILAQIAADDSIISLTNLEIVRYLKAIRSVEITKTAIINHSGMPLWFEADGKTVCVEGYKKYIV